MTRRNPFRYIKTSLEVIRLDVMLYVRFPLSLRNVVDLIYEHGIEVSHETARFWWEKLGEMLAAEIRRLRARGGKPVSRPRRYLPQVRFDAGLVRSS